MSPIRISRSDEAPATELSIHRRPSALTIPLDPDDALGLVDQICHSFEPFVVIIGVLSGDIIEQPSGLGQPHLSHRERQFPVHSVILSPFATLMSIRGLDRSVGKQWPIAESLQLVGMMSVSEEEFRHHA